MCLLMVCSPHLVQEGVAPKGGKVPGPVEHGRDADVPKDLGHKARVVQHLPEQRSAHWPKLDHILQPSINASCALPCLPPSSCAGVELCTKPCSMSHTAFQTPPVITQGPLRHEKVPLSLYQLKVQALAKGAV